MTICTVRRIRQTLATLLSVALVVSTGGMPTHAAELTPTWVQALTPSDRIAHVISFHESHHASTPLILIQDLHFNLQVQHHIAQLLAFIQAQYLTMHVGVEGAAGPLDYSPLIDNESASWTKARMDFLLQNGELSGAEAFTIASHQPRLLQGVENAKYYRFNLELFRHSYESREALRQTLLRLTAQLDEFRARLHVKPETMALAQRAEEASAELKRVTSLLAQQTPLKDVQYVANRLPQTLALIDQLQTVVPDLEPIDHATVEDAIRAAVDFYAAATLRNEPLLTNTLQLAAAHPDASVVMIAGGFHTAELTRLLDAQDASYIVLQPEVTSHSVREEQLYIDRLLGRHVEDAAIARQVGGSHALGVLADIPRVQRISNTWARLRRRAKPALIQIALSMVGMGTLTLGPDEASGTPQPAVPVNDRLSPTQWGRVEEAAHKYGLNEGEKMYVAEMWRQALYPDETKKPLKIGRDEAQGENFILASDLTDQQRREWLGSVPYAELVADPDNARSAQDTVITFNSLDGGIGENVGRLEWLREQARENGVPEEDVQKIRMGAKGTDLGYFIEYNDKALGRRTAFISIAEFKLLQLIKLAERGTFGGIYLQPLVNKDSRGSYERLLNSTFFFDRINSTKTDHEKLNYRAVLNQVGIRFHPQEMLSQSDLPGFEKETGELALNDPQPQPGGHGQWGVVFLWGVYRNTPPNDGKTHIRVFANGDNPNGIPDEHIAGYMRRNNIAILKLTTAATPIDKKGGKDGVELVHVNSHIVEIPEQMEIAQAKKVGQEAMFIAAGQSEEQKGRQPFNTNIIYINETLLHAVLGDLAKVVGEEALTRIISPTRIPKDAKTKSDGHVYEPIDGAIGSAIHNLNKFFQTSQDPRVAAILIKHGIFDEKDATKPGRILRFSDIPRDFFAPVKNNYDIWMQAYSDVYKPNMHDLQLKSADGWVPPEVTFEIKSGPDVKHWNELQNYVRALGHAMTRRLTSLTVQGKVLLRDPRRNLNLADEATPGLAPDAELAGAVHIVNRSAAEVNLYDPQYRAALEGHFTDSGQLVLENVDLTIGEDGTLHVTPIHPAPAPVTYRPWQITLVFLASLATLPLPFFLPTATLKLAYVARQLRREGLSGLALVRGLFRSKPVETFDLEMGTINGLEHQGLLGIVPLAHTLRSHGAFGIRNEILAHLLDFVTIPLEFAHFVLTWLMNRLRSRRISQDELLHSELAQRLGSVTSARLLLTSARIDASGAVRVFQPSTIASRVKRFVGLDASDDAAFTRAYGRMLEAAAA